MPSFQEEKKTKQLYFVRSFTLRSLQLSAKREIGLFRLIPKSFFLDDALTNKYCPDKIVRSLSAASGWLMAYPFVPHFLSSLTGYEVRRVASRESRVESRELWALTIDRRYTKRKEDVLDVLYYCTKNDT